MINKKINRLFKYFYFVYINYFLWTFGSIIIILLLLFSRIQSSSIILWRMKINLNNIINLKKQ